MRTEMFPPRPWRIEAVAERATDGSWTVTVRYQERPGVPFVTSGAVPLCTPGEALDVVAAELGWLGLSED